MRDPRAAGHGDGQSPAMHAMLAEWSASPGGTVRSLISSRNSIRVRALSRNAPSMALVTAKEFCFSTPRIDMHRWVASITTATPSGAIFSRIVLAIWFVSRSCTWSRRLNTSTSRGILLRPMTRLLGMIGDVALAEERQQVVLAQAVEVDVLDDHHLAIIDREQRVVQHLVDVRRVPARQKLERLFDAFRRMGSPSRAGILAELREQLPDQILHPSILYLDCG